ncbi:DNA polymerase-3 subunit alpha [Tindallia magadiensis]|uniref:DNA polymerase III PolC-type n=1 Tax=Tindallia magadiensis TaxID=69895 RepID=A0A1I3AHJ6_9FIRM|nr:PolC-type DNA polymerase III [Tindallia magadiensis]SFH49503.1 DNA polymerase-3 subunit alpha [Tindallia magadiensis]
MTSNKYSLNTLLNQFEINSQADWVSECFVEKLKLITNPYTLNIEFSLNKEIKIVELEKQLLTLGDFFQVKRPIDYRIHSVASMDSLAKLLESDFFSENLLSIIRKKLPISISLGDRLRIEKDKNHLYLVVNDQVFYEKAIERKLEQWIKSSLKKYYGLSISCSIKKSDEFELCRNDFYIQRQNLEKTLVEKSSLTNTSDNKKEIKTNSNSPQLNSSKKKSKNDEKIWVGRLIDDRPINISNITEEDSHIIIHGEVIDVDIKIIKDGRKLYIFDITDYTGSMTAKLFEPRKNDKPLEELIVQGETVVIRGTLQYDHFSRENIVMIADLNKIHIRSTTDDSLEKRVELHCHTSLSQMDGISTPKELFELASKWGHNALAITDHGVVQAFPEVHSSSIKNKVKPIYGMEGYLVDDERKILEGTKNVEFTDEFVVFDLETTGLSNIHDRITEIGAIKISNGVIVDEFSTLVNPLKPISEKITQLTGITNDMVKEAPTIEEVIPKFVKFIKNCVLVAHNSDFDIGFLRENISKLDYYFDYQVLDTLKLSRKLLKGLKRYKLNSVAKALDIKLENHHRAVYDARATAQIFIKLISKMQDLGLNNFGEMNEFSGGENEVIRQKTNHIILLAQNSIGLRNLYNIVSKSHMDYFYKKPRIPKSYLRKNRQGLLLGSACQDGEVYQAILNNEQQDRLEEIASFYDYLEIQPVSNNSFLINKGFAKDIEELKNHHRVIVALGEKINRPVVATGDVHYVSSKEHRYRQILQAGMGFDDIEEDSGLHFKTTEEMLMEFNHLGNDKAYEVVIANTNKISESIEMITPVPEGTFPPSIAGSEETLRNLCFENAHRIYGDPLPLIVEERLTKELNSIIDNGYSVMYMISHQLVSKSLKDGYLVGSRGSVGSSFAATMSDITEVNPLAPHYVCPKCKHSIFYTEGEYESGIDLPDSNCSKCNTPYKKDGHQIPFEVFLGFEGDKEPDIDLNFAGEYQSIAHQYIEHLFGKDHVFRAGTLGTIASKTAYGFVKKYCEAFSLQMNNAEMKRLIDGCTGVKRTTGQHPGGVMIVPQDKDIHEFTPIQHPANDATSGIITTHFDYNALSGKLLKLDILGHDVPTIIRMLEDFTGTNALNIPLDDPETMSLFQSVEALKIDGDQWKPDVGSIGIPEFGTKFVRQMLLDTKPTTFAELVRISGLSHGTDVWLNNAQDLVKDEIASLKEVICTRDDIMNYLILKGVPSKASFKIMENVRKGKGLTDEEEELLNLHQVPKWYIESCKRIKYMFPKAHAVAYVMMSFRIAYYKVHFPEAFYASYFSMKVDDFDTTLALEGTDYIIQYIKNLEQSNVKLTAKEKNQLTVMEVVLEMLSRGIELLPVSLYRSHSEKFTLEDSKIRPPLTSLGGVGQNAARKIYDEAQKRMFLSIEELRNRTGASKVVIETLKEHGACNDLPETNQLSLFQLDLPS